jgi:hypothetical protein
MLFSVGSSPSNDTGQVLDGLLPHSSALLAATDELISTMYTPQQSARVRAELTSFVNVIKQLRSYIFQSSTLVDQLDRMSLDSSSAHAKERRWFDTCFDQIQRAAAALETTNDLDGDKQNMAEALEAPKSFIHECS